MAIPASSIASDTRRIPPPALESIRSRVLNVALVTLTIVALPGLAASLYRMVDIGWRSIMALQIGSYLTLLTTTLLRHRLPFPVRSTVMFFVLFLTGAASIISWGLMGNDFFMVILVILVTILYGTRWGMTVLGLVTLFWIANAIAMRQGLLVYDYSTIDYGTATSTWVSRIVSFGFFSGMAIAAAGQFNAALVQNIADLRFANQLLATEVDERVRMQGELERYRDNLEQIVTQRTAELEDARRDAEQANRVKSEFLARISHELRTPLNALLNFTQFVSSGLYGPINAEQKSALDKSTESARHLITLINDVLDISRIEAGRMELFLEDGVDLLSEMEEVAATMRPLFQGKRLDFVQNIPDDLPRISIDRRRIRQVLLNLLSNAAKFTSSGGVTMTAVHDEQTITICVKDTGSGIPADSQQAVFEAFRQTDSGRQEGGGTGLGLPISRQLVEAHGGEMWFESEPGQGTSFYFTLPIEREISLSEA